MYIISATSIYTRRMRVTVKFQFLYIDSRKSDRSFLTLQRYKRRISDQEFYLFKWLRDITRIM